jgi:hypothetical protein
VAVSDYVDAFKTNVRSGLRSAGNAASEFSDRNKWPLMGGASLLGLLSLAHLLSPKSPPPSEDGPYDHPKGY